jgi:adenine deaminase
MFENVDIDTYFSLMNVAKGYVKADLYLKSATIINVFSSELIKTNVAIKGKYITYVGDSEAMVDHNTEVIDLKGYFLSPGYIEPHSHPFQTYNPDTLARYALSHGTTTMVNDNMGLYLLLKERSFLEFIEEISNWQIKMLWSTRLSPQTKNLETNSLFATDTIKRLLSHPLIIQAGELTGWPDLLKKDKQLGQNMLEAIKVNKRIEGHLPGASIETLCMLATAGVTADHEGMNTEEIINRLRLGLWTTLRYSSLRPDLPNIIRGFHKTYNTNRMMLTTDGSTPSFLEKGVTDNIVQVAIESGLDPIKAYQMVTINPATYYGLDSKIGGIGPGRYADILVLDSLYSPTPKLVFSEGKLTAKEGKLIEPWPYLDWEKYGFSRINYSWAITPKDFSQSKNLPIIHMENAVITRLASKLDTDNLLFVSLIDKKGEWIVEALLDGMAKEVDGLASSYTASQDILTIGRSHKSISKAVNRILEIGGGIVLVEDDNIIFELHMPIYGKATEIPMEDLISKTKKFEYLLKERGYCHSDPIYTLLFLSSPHLPSIRLTSQGVKNVKTGELISSSKKLE